MKDFEPLIAAYLATDFTQHQAVLATVMRVRGSSYRSPGARMLILDNGQWVGCISGGCLEGDALRKARSVMNSRIPILETYDTREESSQYLGISLGCHGVIDVLFESVTPDAPDNPLAIMLPYRTRVNPLPMATVFNQTLSKVFRYTPENASTPPDVVSLLDEIQSGRKVPAVETGDSLILTEYHQPVPQLIIFGGGFDARPVVTLAKNLGWKVSITDECVAHIAPVFFPQADQLTLCSRDKAGELPELKGKPVCLLMSHNFEYDKDILSRIVEYDLTYIGIIGPRKRFVKLCEELNDAGYKHDFLNDPRIYSPAGLDIGADRPEEIALSLISEIQQVLSGASGESLRTKPGPIHQREGDQVLR